MDTGYDPSLMQRIFHYCMIIMVWGINQIALESVSIPDGERDDGRRGPPTGEAPIHEKKKIEQNDNNNNDVEMEEIEEG